jgi:hypothetical protein
MGRASDMSKTSIRSVHRPGDGQRSIPHPTPSKPLDLSGGGVKPFHQMGECVRTRGQKPYK